MTATSIAVAIPLYPSHRSSGDQVLGEHTIPRWVVCLITSPSQLLSFLGAQQEC